MNDDLEKKIKAAAEGYPNVYEMTLMNDDTPRLSGREYLTHGYAKGARFGYSLAQEEIQKLKKEIDELQDQIYESWGEDT